MRLAAAMVLAAGRGERMQPLSRVLPKPALPLLDQPVVASALRLATTVGTERLVVNTWHLADAMERLTRRCHRIVWMNPHKGDDPDFRPMPLAKFRARQ